MMMEKKSGTFYGVGVGPGDPELMTLKARRVLTDAPVIAYPSADSSIDGSSRALSIVEKAVDIAGKEVMELVFPMTKDKEALKAARREAAGRIIGKLKEGRDVAFITLGDPMFYSTFSYLVPFVLNVLPGAAVESVPGITSFSAAASASVQPLAESDDKVIIIPAAYDLTLVRTAFEEFDTVVLMKVNRTFDALLGLLEEMGLDDKAVLATRVGWPEEEVTSGLKGFKGKKIDYFSTVIVRKGA